MLMYNDKEPDYTKLRYVLYARKSTDDPQRQIRSIPDQIDECKQLASRMGIRIVKVLEETKSAKKPNQRPIFNQMIKDIRAGIYDGILAWNPDRLARNMLEGGMLIDLVDNEIIKDFKFVTHHFTKDANGLMLLGMAFVLSKQYSDKLSQDVKRGVEKKLLEGKSPAYKHGYTRDENGFYRPDGKNFELIKEAWQMRKDGTSIEEISKHMNNKGYIRIVERKDKEPKLIDMDFRILSRIFQDSLYYGVLVQAGTQKDLRNTYDFKPAVEEEDFFAVQQLSQHRLKPFNTKKNKAFYPLKGLLVCDSCGHNMVITPSTSGDKKHKYLNCRCDNPDCTREKRSCRMKFVFNWIYDFLENYIDISKAEYNTYYDKISTINQAEREK